MPRANIPAKITPIAVSSLIPAPLLSAPMPSEVRMAVTSPHQKTGPMIAAAGQVADSYTWQDGMRQGVAEEGHAA